MLKKLSAFILVTSATASVAFAQKSPEPAKPSRPAAPMVFSFSPDMFGGYIGVGLTEVSNDNFAKFGLAEVRGAAVEKVVENSPAAKAGIQVGDVVVKFDGDNVTSVRKFQRLISEAAPDHKVTLTIVRGGAEQDVVVTVGKRDVPKLINGSFSGSTLMRELPAMPQMPEAPQVREFPQIPQMPSMPRVQSLPPGDDNGMVILGDSQMTFTFGSSRRIGVTVSTLSKQLGDYFGTDGKGLLINDVRKDSAAERAGLKAGDVILEVDGKVVDGNNELVRAVNSKKDGDVVLTIIRDRQRLTISVTPDRAASPEQQLRLDGRQVK